MWIWASAQAFHESNRQLAAADEHSAQVLGPILAGLPKALRKHQARMGSIAKLKRDPSQLAKQEAFKLWSERRAGKHPKLRTNEQFATECMRQWPVLTSAKVILGWCAKWAKEARSPPAC